MADAVTFEQLLMAASDTDLTELEGRRDELVEKRDDLQAQVTEVQAELREVQGKIAAPIRDAVKAAKLLGVEVPEDYQQAGHNGNGSRSSGKYHWAANGQVPFQATISNAMWRLSHNSGGSAGRKGEGVLTAAEFWALVDMDEQGVELGKRHEVTLPNGKDIMFQKIEE